MWSSLWLKGDGGIRKNILFFSKAFSKHFPLLIPHHHDLSLFLPGKLLLSFLAILRKELQQSPIMFKILPYFYPIRFFTCTFQTTIANQVLQFLHHFTFGFLRSLPAA